MASLVHILNNTRGINIDADPSDSPLQDIKSIAKQLRDDSYMREADILCEVLEKCTGAKNFGGLGLDEQAELSAVERDEVLFLCEAWLESINSTDKQVQRAEPLRNKPKGRRGMTYTEKIFAMHDVQPRGSVKPGEVIRVAVDWIMASELSWGGMKKTYDLLGQPGIFRNDRFWLAGDHLADPRVNHRTHIKQAIDESEEAKATFKMTEYQGLNVGPPLIAFNVSVTDKFRVHHNAYRVLSRTSRSRDACDRFGFSHVLRRSCERPGNRPWCSRCYDGLGRYVLYL